jgi:hypothetical protein
MLEVGVAGMIQLTKASTANSTMTANTLVAVLFVGLFGLTPIFFIIFYIINKRKIGNPDDDPMFAIRCGSLFSEFRNESGF